jgi:hypothetical protein
MRICVILFSERNLVMIEGILETLASCSTLQKWIGQCTKLGIEWHCVRGIFDTSANTIMGNLLIPVQYCLATTLLMPVWPVCASSSINQSVNLNPAAPHTILSTQVYLSIQPFIGTPRPRLIKPATARAPPTTFLVFSCRASRDIRRKQKRRSRK